jgi:branched-chain amino acid transport system substrate-binding protein
LAIPGDNIYRFVSSDVIQGQAMSKMLAEDKVKMLVPIIRNDVWGNDLLKATQKDFIKRGGLVSASQNYDPASSDFSAVLTQLSEKVTEILQTYDPNDVAVYLLSFAEGSQILAQAKAYKDLNNVYWYGGSAFASNSSVIADTSAALFAYTHGLPCPVFGLDDAAKSKWEPLREQIKSQIGRYPDAYALTAYDALWVLVKTNMVVGENTGIENFKTAFVSESDSYFGATGHTLLDVNGDRAIGNYDVWSVKYDSSNYYWKLTARYNSADGTLTRFKP